MKKNLLLTFSASLISLGSVVSADFKASGTDYSNALASQEKWSEDAANEFVTMPNSFACIISNSGAVDNPNGNWTSLIDEAACGLAEPDPKGATVYSSSAMKSSRASNTSPQEVTAWFNAQGGSRYIADVTLKNGADSLPPFGEWYFSFYRAGELNSGTWTTYTKDTAKEFGYVDIGKSGNDVAILVATEMEIDENIGGQNVVIDDDTYAKVVFVGGSSDNTKFVGKTNNVITLKSNGANTGFGSGYEMIAGATSANYYFRQNLDSSGNLVANTNACFDRTQQFETAHQGMLFDATTGKKVNLTGGFGFTKADGTRGYLGSWGVWIDGGDTNFTTNSRSLAITNDDGVNYSIKWAPGKLQEKTLSEDTLANGDTFKMWYDELQEIINDENYPITTDHILVLRNAGPKGGPGMPEWGMIPMPKALLKQGHRDMIRLSDARMSGTSYGACILHVAPEAYIGGPLALIKTGDIIEIDIPSRKLNVNISENEMEERRKRWIKPTPRFERGYGYMYSKHIEQADKGCDFDFLRTDFGSAVREPDIN